MARKHHFSQHLFRPQTALAALALLLAEERLRRRRRQGARADLYTFDPARRLLHDVIDPEQAEQQCDYTYPILLEQFTRL